jgi:hypothetical protein
MPEKITYRDINGRKTAISKLLYDRNLEISFNKFTKEEIIEFKTLMRHVGGINAVAFELFKEDNGYINSSKRPVKSGEEVIYVPVKEFFYSKEGKQVKVTYRHKVCRALNYNLMKGNNSGLRTVEVVKLINKLATYKEQNKERAGMRVSKFIVNKNQPAVNPEKDEAFIEIKETLNSITSE